MPASRVQIELPQGLRNLYCPACAAPVITEADGTAEETCDHVRFFIDATGELSLAEPDGFTGDDRAQQQAVVDLVERTDSWDDFLDEVMEVLPDSVLILELTDAGAADSEDGSTAVVAFDLASPDRG